MIEKIVAKYNLNDPASKKNDLAYWRSQPFSARLEALEQIRQEYHSWRYNAEQGFQRVYKILKREQS